MSHSQLFSEDSFVLSDQAERFREDLRKAEDKLAKEKRKNKQFKSLITEITFKCQLLEEENKLLQMSKQEQTTKTSELQNLIPTSKVSLLLSDLDILLASQNEEITELISERDSLVQLYHRYINSISFQESLINHFALITNKLFRHICDRKYSENEIIEDFKKYGINIEENMKRINRFNKISDLTLSLSKDPNRLITVKQLEPILLSLQKTHLDDPTIEIIIGYLVQQTTLEKDYYKKINERDKIIEMLKADYNDSQKLIKQICSKFSNVQNQMGVLRQIDDFKQEIENSKMTYSLFQKLVGTFAAFGQGYKDTHIQNCVNNLQSWLQNPASKIDVIQEIDFLLGMFMSGKSSEEIQPSSIDLKPSSQHNKHSRLYNEKQISNQVAYLKRNVIEMKEKLLKADAERRNYISSKLNSSIHPDSTWTQICDYILTKQSGLY